MELAAVVLTPKLELLLDVLRSRKNFSSYKLAVQTLDALQDLVTVNNWKCARQLVEQISELAKRSIQANATETMPRNIALRVLKIIRDEFASLYSQNQQQSTDGHNAGGLHRQYHVHGIRHEEYLQRLLISDDGQQLNLADTQAVDVQSLREALLEGLLELRTELDTSAELIAAQSLEHIQTNELVLTLGHSKSVEAFLKYAARKNRKFQVIVAEGAPFNHGHDMAISLSNAGIPTTVIPDSSILAVMPRINKVVIGTHSVMANGGLKAVSGAHLIALAARNFSVPLLVCTAMFKVSTQYLNNHDQVTQNKFGSSQQLLPYSGTALSPKAQVINPVFDYVPPELVTIFISNIGGNSPSYIYRLLSELYHSEDILEK